MAGSKNYLWKKEKNMSAKQKLNSMNALGSLALAAIIGGLAGSWAVFVLAAVVLIALAVESGEIRL